MTDTDELRAATGLKKDRMEALHDAIFAVAMTLLVLGLQVPHGATSFADFMGKLHADLPQFYASAIAYLMIGMMWINHYYRHSMVVRVDFTHLALNVAAAGAVVLVPFSTKVLADYWVNPWGVAIFSWNVCLAIILYAIATRHYIRYLIPKQVDQSFLRLNVAYMFTWVVITGVAVPALAFVSPLAAVLIIPILAAINVVTMARWQPRFIAAHRIAVAHAEDDLRSVT